jgi:hypothetical protein
MTNLEGKKRLKAYLLKYRIDNENAIALQKRDYYARNKEKLKTYQRWYNKNRRKRIVN